jgi:hypothetical protein
MDESGVSELRWGLTIGQKMVAVLGTLCTTPPSNNNQQLSTTLHKAMPWLKRLVAGLSPRRPGFAPGSIHAGFVVDKVALGQVFVRVPRFPLSISFHRRSPNSYHLGKNNMSGSGSSSETSHPIISSINQWCHTLGAINTTTRTDLHSLAGKVTVRFLTTHLTIKSYGQVEVCLHALLISALIGWGTRSASRNCRFSLGKTVPMDRGVRGPHGRSACRGEADSPCH